MVHEFWLVVTPMSKLTRASKLTLRSNKWHQSWLWRTRQLQRFESDHKVLSWRTLWGMISPLSQTITDHLHTTPPLPCAHHRSDKQIEDHATMANLSPSAGGPHMAEATETFIYSSWMVRPSAIAQSLTTSRFFFGQLLSTKATNHYEWPWLPTWAIVNNSQ